MKKFRCFLYLLVFSLVLASCSQAVGISESSQADNEVNATGTKEMAEHDYSDPEDSDLEAVNFEPGERVGVIREKMRYKSGEHPVVYVRALCEEVITGISFEEDGMEVLSAERNEAGTEYVLTLAMTKDKGSVVIATRIDDYVMKWEVSAVDTEKGIFVVIGDYQFAWMVYLYSGVEDGEYSNEEYVRLRDEYFRSIDGGGETTVIITYPEDDPEGDGTSRSTDSAILSGTIQWKDTSNNYHNIS